MKKLYQKPDIEYVSLQAEEEIATTTRKDDTVDGDMDLESSIF